MSRQKRGRKQRTPQKRVPRSPSVPRPRVAAAVLPSGGLPLRGSLDATARMLEHAKPDQLVELVLPYLWVALADGRVPANVCVDACMTLRNAYGQLGVRAELLPCGDPEAGRKRHPLRIAYSELDGNLVERALRAGAARLRAVRGRHRGAVRRGPRDRNGPDGRQGGPVDRRRRLDGGAGGAGGAPARGADADVHG